MRSGLDSRAPILRPPVLMIRPVGHRDSDDVRSPFHAQDSTKTRRRVSRPGRSQTKGPMPGPATGLYHDDEPRIEVGLLNIQ